MAPVNSCLFKPSPLSLIGKAVSPFRCHCFSLHFCSTPRGPPAGAGGVAGDLDLLFFFGMPWGRLASPDVVAGRLAADSLGGDFRYFALSVSGFRSSFVLSSIARFRYWEFRNKEEFDSLL